MEDKELIKSFSNYTNAQLANFRKSIQAMGTPVNNGTIVIPEGTDLAKRPILVNIKPDDILKTPTQDIKSWRKFSRVYFAHPLYRRILEYFANLYYNYYIISPIFDDKKPNKKKLMKDYNAALRSLDEDIKVETFTNKVLLDLLIEGETYYFNEEYKKGANYYYKPIKLPTDYCKIIGTAGTPAINIFAALIIPSIELWPVP